MKLFYIRELMMGGVDFETALLRWEAIERESAALEKEHGWRKREAQENLLWGMEINV